MSSCLQAALDAMAAGISVVPPAQDGSKRPDSDEWKTWQVRRADEAQLLAWYKRGRTGVGWVTGAVSGNLEVLDFDDRSIWQEYQKLCRESGIGPLLDRVIAGYFEHSPNGAHLAYRCSAIEGNQKLAKRPVPDKVNEWKTLVETRGEGGFIIVAPSHGSVNLRGAYALQSGGINSIVTLTPEERRMLFDVARIFDESPPPAEVRAPKVNAAGRPGDDFNARARWEDVLEPHGWVKVASRLGVVSWRRPGKDRGISATTNYAGSDLLYVFSTSTGFESERGYSKFSAYGILEHGGDFEKAAGALLTQGYGIEEPGEVDISGIMAQPSRGAATEDRPPELAGLLRVPGLVGEIAEWINESSLKLQPILAIAASIVAVASLVGRKAKTSTGLRANLFVLGVGETGCGKERARQAIGRLFYLLGIDDMLGDSFASDSAVEAAIATDPARLYLIDEMGYFLGTMRDAMAPSHIKSIVPVLLKIYESSQGVYRKRTYALNEKSKNNKEITVDQPFLSIYGTTVPSNFYANITKAHLSNGLLSRLLVFESQSPDPEVRLISDERREPPSRLVEACRVWVQRGINSDPNAGNIEARTVAAPMTVSATSKAMLAYETLERRMRRRREIEREAGRDHGPFMRVQATAMKLGLIRACGVNPESPEVTQDDAEWGCDLAWRLTEDFMAKVGDAAPESKVEADCQKVVTAVTKAGGKISRMRLLRAVRGLTSRQLDEVARTLIEAGDITMDNVASGGGRPKTMYFLPGKKGTSFPESSSETTREIN